MLTWWSKLTGLVRSPRDLHSNFIIVWYQVINLDWFGDSLRGNVGSRCYLRNFSCVRIVLGYPRTDHDLSSLWISHYLSNVRHLNYNNWLCSEIIRICVESAPKPWPPQPLCSRYVSGLGVWSLEWPSFTICCHRRGTRACRKSVITPLSLINIIIIFIISSREVQALVLLLLLKLLLM